MVYKIGDNITSPLGWTTDENLHAVMAGRSALALYEGRWGVPCGGQFLQSEGFCASLFSEEQNARFAMQGLTRLEALAVCSIRQALEGVNLSLSDNRVVLILSTAKANVEELTLDASTTRRSLPGTAAQHVAHALGIRTMPIAVCNACISGVSAITLAKRMLESALYDYAIVCGADCQSHFVVSGFQSLRSLSDQPCRPFDEERLGLNLGEAASTLILSNTPSPSAPSGWTIRAAAVTNDASHLTNPSRTGEGCYLAISRVMAESSAEDLALINAHGTATMYNDQMESVAIERSGLHSVPVNALKGYFGHTMGAAGVLETVLTMHALDNGVIPGTRGYSVRGVSGEISLTPQHTGTKKSSFLKLVSGFGGCNAALVAERRSAEAEPSSTASPVKTEVTHCVRIVPGKVVVDGKVLLEDSSATDLLSRLYKAYIGDYPKFYKMDKLCQLGFVATELLLQTEGSARFEEGGNRAVVLAGTTASAVADVEYLKTISDVGNYYPSPSAFIYTLPNMVTGEIAIRNKYHGETSFYVLPQRNDTLVADLAASCFADGAVESAIAGWLDYGVDGSYEADLQILVRNKQ